MRITISQTVQHDVTLSDDDIERATLNYLKSIVRPGDYLQEKDGKTLLIQCEEDLYGSHSSFSEKVVREATELDKAVFTVLSHLYKSRGKRDKSLW